MEILEQTLSPAAAAREISRNSYFFSDPPFALSLWNVPRSRGQFQNVATLSQVVQSQSARVLASLRRERERSRKKERFMGRRLLRCRYCLLGCIVQVVPGRGCLYFCQFLFFSFPPLATYCTTRITTLSPHSFSWVFNAGKGLEENGKVNGSLSVCRPVRARAAAGIARDSFVVKTLQLCSQKVRGE